MCNLVNSLDTNCLKELFSQNPITLSNEKERTIEILTIKITKNKKHTTKKGRKGN